MEDTGAISSYKKACKYPNLLPLYESRMSKFTQKAAYLIFNTAREQVDAGQIN